MQKSKKAKVDP